MKISTIRRLTILLFVILVVVALTFHTGTGNLSSLGWQSIAYICPLGALESLIAAKTLIPRPLIALALLLIAGFFLGKVFCAWVCPVPPIKKFFDRKAWKELRQQRKEQKAKDGEVATEAVAVEAKEEAEAEPETAIAPLSEAELAGLSSCGTKGCSSCAEKRRKLDSRHLVLGGALASAAIFGFPVFCLVCPVGLVFASIVAWWRFVGFAELTLSLVVFPAIVLVEVLLLRKWCLKFCPLGALMSLLSLPNKFFKPKVDTSKCLREQGIECNECVKVCPEMLDPHSGEGMHECSKCGLCMEKCPAHAITIPFKSVKDAFPEKAEEKVAELTE